MQSPPSSCGATVLTTTPPPSAEPTCVNSLWRLAKAFWHEYWYLGWKIRIDQAVTTMSHTLCGTVKQDGDDKDHALQVHVLLKSGFNIWAVPVLPWSLDRGQSDELHLSAAPQALIKRASLSHLDSKQSLRVSASGAGMLTPHTPGVMELTSIDSPLPFRK